MYLCRSFFSISKMKILKYTQKGIKLQYAILLILLTWWKAFSGMLPHYPLVLQPLVLQSVVCTGDLNRQNCKLLTTGSQHTSTVFLYHHIFFSVPCTTIYMAENICKKLLWFIFAHMWKPSRHKKESKTHLWLWMLAGINFELLLCLNMLVLTEFIPISELCSLCLLRHWAM